MVTLLSLAGRRIQRRCAGLTTMRPARRGIHHEWMWLTSDEAALTPIIPDGHAEFNPSITESTSETLTDTSAGVKLIVHEKLTGASRAPADFRAWRNGVSPETMRRST
jgi:hypothetical protein